MLAENLLNPTERRTRQVHTAAVDMLSLWAWACTVALYSAVV